MEDKDRLKETYDHLLAYLKERFELLRLQFADRGAREVSTIVSKVLLLTVILLALFFLSTALAIYLGKLLGNMAYGFAVVGAGYLFLFLILALLRRPLIERPITNGVIKRFFKGSDDE